jgi:archaeal type IV pilus assembly protein PilA
MNLKRNSNSFSSCRAVVLFYSSTLSVFCLILWLFVFFLFCCSCVLHKSNSVSQDAILKRVSAFLHAVEFKGDKTQMNTFRTIKKNSKALSPVVASIILIAVTVAVSVAVAAWMGGMTIGFMGTSSVTVTNLQFTGGVSGAADNTIDLALKNTGTKTASIASVKVNNGLATTDETLPISIDAGKTGSIQITAAGWVDGNTYKIDLFDGSNQVVGSIQANAPGA